MFGIRQRSRLEVFTCWIGVRRGSASPVDAHLRLGFALGSGSALLWAKGPNEGHSPAYF